MKTLSRKRMKNAIMHGSITFNINNICSLSSCCCYDNIAQFACFNLVLHVVIFFVVDCENMCSF